MKVDLKELVKVLDALKPGLSGKAVVDQMQHYHFMGDKVMTFNDRLLVCAPFDTGVTGSVHANSLYKILYGCSDPEGEMSGDDNTIYIKTKSLKVEMSMVSEQTPVVVKMKEIWNSSKDTSVLPQDFNTALKLCCQNSLKSDKYQGYSQMVKIHGSDVVCLQTLRGSWYSMRNPVEDSFYLPLDCALDLLNFNLAACSVGEEGWKTFEDASGTVVMCVTANMPEFPKYRNVFAKTIEAAIPIPLTKEVADASSIVGVMGEGEVDVDKKINVKISKGGAKMELIGSRTEGRVTCSVLLQPKEEVEDFQFKINPEFLKTLAERGDELLVTNNAVVVDSPTFKHMCMISLVEEEE